jgi:hypothetical protein
VFNYITIPRKQTKEIFIERSIKKFGTIFDYTNVIYNGADTLVTIICPEHGEYTQTPYLHLKSKHGCRNCGDVKKGKKVPKKELINSFNTIHNNKYNYSKVKYKTIRDKIIIICPDHGEFNQIAHDHKNGSGCPKCAGVYRYTTEEFIDKMKKINNYYDYSLIEYKNSSTKVNVKCPEHGIFSITPNHLSQGTGCPKCGIGIMIKKNTMSCEEFIRRCIEKFKNKFDYSLVEYKNSNTNIKIICNACKYIFTPKPYNHLHSESGCPKCTNCLQLNTNIFIERCNKIYNNKYDYSIVEYKTSYDMVNIICNEHGIFSQLATSHLRGHGCNKCGGTKISNTEEFITKVTKVHGENVYDYTLVNYKNSKTKVKIICLKHGLFLQGASSHLAGCGCPCCSNSRGYSRAQIQWLTYLSVHKDIQHAETEGGEYSIPNYLYSADGYDAKSNTIYEYHGDFWHGNPRYHHHQDINPISKKKYGELFKATLKKELLLRNIGYNYKCIWESDWIKGIKAVVKIQRQWRHRYT